MTAPNSVSVGDLEYAYLKAASPAADLNLTVALGQGIVTLSQQENITASTKAASGNVTAPGAGATVASLNISTTGYYRIVVTAGFGATAESTAIDNFQLKVNGSVVGTIPVANVANTQSQPLEFFANVTAGSPAITVVAIGAASASSVYKATILATRRA